MRFEIILDYLAKQIIMCIFNKMTTILYMQTQKWGDGQKPRCVDVFLHYQCMTSPRLKKWKGFYMTLQLALLILKY